MMFCKKEVFMFLNKYKFSSLLFSFMLSIFIFTSCDFEFTDSKLNRPDVEAIQSGIAITIQKENSDCDYINLYRAEKTIDEKLDFKKIGIIFPKAFNDKNDSYLFEDTTVIKGKSYVYYARSYDSKEGYFPSNITNPIKAENGLPEDTNISELMFQTNFTFKYDEIEKTISPTTNIELLSNPYLPDYNTALVVSKVEKDNEGNKIITRTQSFLLSDETLIANDGISILTLLPEDFLSSGFIIEGLIGQKIEYKLYDPNDITSESNICRVYWTDLAPVTVQDKNNLPIEEIRIETQYGADGFDYSE